MFSIYGNPSMNGLGYLEFGGSVLTDDSITADNITVNNNLTVNSVSNVNGISNVNGVSNVNGILNLNGISNLNGPTKLKNSLDVSGACIIGNTVNISGATTLNDDFTVAGLTSLNGATNINNNIASTSINTGALVVGGGVGISGNIYVGGKTNVNNLSVTGATYVASLSLSSSLYVSGTTTLAGATKVRSSLDISGACIISNTVTVSGATTLNNNLTVAGLTTLNGATTFNDNFTINGITTLNGPTKLASSLDVSGGSVLDNYLTVSGIGTFNGRAILNDTLDVSGATNLNGLTTINNAFNVYGITNFNNQCFLNNTMTALGTTFLNGINTYLTGNVIFDNSFSNTKTTVKGEIYFYNISVHYDVATFTDRIRARSSLDVSGYCHLSSLDVLSSTKLSHTLDVSGATNITNTLAVSGATNVNNQLTVLGASHLNYTLDVLEATTLSNTLSVAGTTELYNTLLVAGATKINSNLDVSGNIVSNGNITLNGDVFYKEPIKLITRTATDTNNVSISGTQSTIDTITALPLYDVYCDTSVSTLVLTYNVPAFYQFDVLFNIPIGCKWINNYPTAVLSPNKVLFNNNTNDMIISILKDGVLFKTINMTVGSYGKQIYISSACVITCAMFVNNLKDITFRPSYSSSSHEYKVLIQPNFYLSGVGLGTNFTGGVLLNTTISTTYDYIGVANYDTAPGINYAPFAFSKTFYRLATDGTVETGKLLCDVVEVNNSITCGNTVITGGNINCDNLTVSSLFFHHPIYFIASTPYSVNYSYIISYKPHSYLCAIDNQYIGGYDPSQYGFLTADYGNFVKGTFVAPITGLYSFHLMGSTPAVSNAWAYEPVKKLSNGNVYAILPQQFGLMYVMNDSFSQLRTVDSSIMVKLNQGEGFFYTTINSASGGWYNFVRFTGKFEGYA